MKNVRLSVSVGCTINIGNFENIKLDVGLDADVPDNSNIDLQYDTLYILAEEQLQNIIKNKMSNVVKTMRK